MLSINRTSRGFAILGVLILAEMYGDYVICNIDTVWVFLPKCPLTTVRCRFSADKLQIIRGEAICCSSALKLLLTDVRGHFGRKNEYRYLTYTTITGNSFDRKPQINKVSMICFGYPKLKFNISMAFICHDCRLWICARANFAHAFLRT